MRWRLFGGKEETGRVGTDDAQALQGPRPPGDKDEAFRKRIRELV